jgi:hypothetical protein
LSKKRFLLVCLVVGLVLALWAWLTDFVTIQGEATVYTVGCSGGEWKGPVCTGQLVAGDPYRFRALPRRQEVLFWRLGVAEPSGRFTGCHIQDGRNWVCPANGDTARTITVALVRGEALHDADGHAKPFHAVRKWRWLLLRRGVSTGQAADY